MRGSDLISSDRWQSQTLLCLIFQLCADLLNIGVLFNILALSRRRLNSRNDFSNSLRWLFPFIEFQVDYRPSFQCLVLCWVWVFLTLFFLCFVFVDNLPSLLASLESFQSSEVIEEHSAQLDWIIKVTCSL